MRVYLVLASILMIAVIFVSCEMDNQPTFVETTDTEAQNLEKRDLWQHALDMLGEKFTSSLKNGDVDGFMECVWNSPDFIFVNADGQITRGWDNMRAGVEGLINSTEWRELTVDEISSFKLGDEVYSVGLATWKFQLKGGSYVEFQEVWTDVAKRIDGKFVYIVDHAHDLTPFNN